MLYKEISKKNPELFNFWDKDRIKGAFNFGNGTEKDLRQYAENNKKYMALIKIN